MYQRVGTEFGKYHIRRVLGAGGMAAVYYALDATNGLPVALKILSAQLATIPSFRQRFELEGHITARLAHPNIVPVLDYGVVGDGLYIAMRYLSGGSLHDRFVLEGTMGLQETGRYLEQLASALDYAHVQGVIHRDLKLANVLLDDNHCPLLSDFGIARLVESSFHLTDSGSVLGSPHYMSPEQNEGKPLDARSDLYSLAVMVYLMITGQFPFHADTAVAIALQHVTKPPPPPSTINPELPGAIDGVLLKGLAKAQADRFSSAAEFSAAFTRAIGDCDSRTLIRLAQFSGALSGGMPTVGSLALPVAEIVSPSPIAPSGVPLTIPAAALPDMLDSGITPAHGRKLGRASTGARRHEARQGHRPRWTYVFYPAALVILFVGVLALFRAGLAQFAPGLATSPTLTVAVGGRVTNTPHPVPSQTNKLTPTTPPSITPTLVVLPLPPQFSAISKDLYTPVNVRAGPGINYQVIAQLSPSDEALILARTGSSDQTWYLIRTTQGKVGWVSTMVIDVLPTGGNLSLIPTAATIPSSPTPVLTPAPQPRG
ncbi:MAG: protein kinase domain-containing protein [Aggregatilineales bacterium]